MRRPATPHPPQGTGSKVLVRATMAGRYLDASTLSTGDGANGEVSRTTTVGMTASPRDDPPGDDSLARGQHLYKLPDREDSSVRARLLIFHPPSLNGSCFSNFETGSSSWIVLVYYSTVLRATGSNRCLLKSRPPEPTFRNQTQRPGVDFENPGD
jgi:hypothetical protein